jgi:hypothetical protein
VTGGQASIDAFGTREPSLELLVLPQLHKMLQLLAFEEREKRPAVGE